MARTEISNSDLVWVFTEKLKSFGDCAPAISIAIVPNKDGWTAIASRRDRMTNSRCVKRIQQVQSELRELYILAKVSGVYGTFPYLPQTHSSRDSGLQPRYFRNLPRQRGSPV